MRGNIRRWRRLTSIAVLVAAFAATTTVTNAVREAPALAAPPTPGVQYYLQNVNSGLRMEVAFASTAVGAPIIQGGGTSTTLQAHWRFAPVTVGFYQIINRRSGLCLNVGPASVRLVIRQNSCTSLVTFTHWTLTENSTGNFTITGRTSSQSLCMIGDLTFSAVPLVSDAANSSCDKRFRLVPV